MQKFFAICFSATAFFSITIINIVKGHELYFCLKKGLIGLFLFFIFGYFFGLMYNMIVDDRTTNTVSKG